ncbi:MAG: hypothetical protein Ct9H90mP2_01540 [Dehalococcoidia bacterium]|nr:MAG: hypothetical protein Ct9H90mP2_01540 [Dehalococcoidia bacterium]
MQQLMFLLFQYKNLGIDFKLFFITVILFKKKDQENLRNLGNSLAIFEKIRREVVFFDQPIMKIAQR